MVFISDFNSFAISIFSVSYTHLRAHETVLDLVCRLLLEKKDTPEINILDQNNIEGTLKTQGRKNIFKPDNDIKENYWFSLNREDISKFTGKEFSNYIIYLDGNYQFPRPKKITANISNNHKKYAMTWFSLAISILLLYLYFRKKNY